MSLKMISKYDISLRDYYTCLKTVGIMCKFYRGRGKFNRVFKKQKFDK